LFLEKSEIKAKMSTSIRPVQEHHKTTVHKTSDGGWIYRAAGKDIAVPDIDVLTLLFGGLFLRHSVIYPLRTQLFLFF
jgi:hypothetical protein